MKKKIFLFAIILFILIIILTRMEGKPDEIKAFFIFIPTVICLTIGFLLIKKGIKLSNYDPVTDKKGAILVEAKIVKWKCDTEYSNSFAGVTQTNKTVYRPLLTYSINNTEYIAVDSCYIGYNQSMSKKYPSGTTVNIVGIPSKFGKYKTWRIYI